jgi:hypothetical protein
VNPVTAGQQVSTPPGFVKRLVSQPGLAHANAEVLVVWGQLRCAGHARSRYPCGKTVLAAARSHRAWPTLLNTTVPSERHDQRNTSILKGKTGRGLQSTGTLSVRDFADRGGQPRVGQAGRGLARVQDLQG